MNGNIWISFVLSFCHFFLQLRQSQSYCTDTGCPQERMCGHCTSKALFFWLSSCVSIPSVKSETVVFEVQRCFWFQYQVPVVKSAEELTWRFLWSWWDGWCWLCSCSCFAHQVSEVPQANLMGPIMSVLITLLLTQQWHSTYGQNHCLPRRLTTKEFFLFLFKNLFINIDKNIGIFWDVDFFLL